MDDTSNSTKWSGADDKPDPSEVMGELDRILADDAFQASPRRQAMLRFIVEETLSGRGDRLTAVPIAQSIFGRDENFDHQSDPVVRVEARRLRRDLDSYYSGPGCENQLRISIPKGSYVARFEWHSTHNGAVQDQPAPTKALDSNRLRWIIAGAVVAAFVGAAILALVRWQTIDPETMIASDERSILELPKGGSIAVLPFLNLSGQADKQYMSDGISEQIATELARFRDLWVLPLGSVESLKDGLADADEIRRRYDVDFILEGSVRLTDGTIRITSRLIDADSARYIWVKTFNDTLDPANIYGVQDAIAQEVSANLAGKYGVVAHKAMTRSKRKAPHSFEAYDCVLRYYEYQNSISPELYPDVRTCLERAVEVEPEYAEAWALLANIYMQEKRFGYGDDVSGSAAKRAKAAVRRAIELDPQSSTAHVILSTLEFTEGNLPAFREAGERAVRLNPNNSVVLAHYGLRLALSGNWDAGMPILDKAMALNPEHPDWYRFAEVFRDYELGNYEAALSTLDQIEMPGFLWSHLLRTSALAQLGRLEDARTSADALIAVSSDFEENGLDYIRVWQLPQPLRLKIVDGLARADLDLTKEPGSPLVD